MRLYKHPTKPGWLIGTPEVERLINAPHRLLLPDGAQVHPLHFTPVDFTDDNVAAVQTWAAEFINTYAGELRTKIGTDIPFQGDVYQLKETEAKAFSTDNAPDATKYPVMFAEAAARQMQPADVAAEYLKNSKAWPVLLAQIEALRLGSLSKLQTAKSIADIEAVLGALE